MPSYILPSLITESVLDDDQICVKYCSSLHFPLLVKCWRITELSKHRFMYLTFGDLGP